MLVQLSGDPGRPMDLIFRRSGRRRHLWSRGSSPLVGRQPRVQHVGNPGQSVALIFRRSGRRRLIWLTGSTPLKGSRRPRPRPLMIAIRPLFSQRQMPGTGRGGGPLLGPKLMAHLLGSELQLDR